MQKFPEAHNRKWEQCLTRKMNRPYAKDNFNLTSAEPLRLKGGFFHSYASQVPGLSMRVVFAASEPTRRKKHHEKHPTLDLSSTIHRLWTNQSPDTTSAFQRLIWEKRPRRHSSLQSESPKIKLKFKRYLLSRFLPLHPSQTRRRQRIKMV